MKQLYVIPYTTNTKGLIDKVYLTENTNTDSKLSKSLFKMEMSIGYFNTMLLNLFPPFTENDDLYEKVSDSLDILKDDDTESVFILNVTKIKGLKLKTHQSISNIINDETWYDFGNNEISAIQSLIIHNLQTVMPPKK